MRSLHSLQTLILYLFKDQIFKFLELTVGITETIVEAIFIVQFLKLALTQSSVSFSYLNVGNVKQNFINYISLEIISCTYMIKRKFALI